MKRQLEIAERKKIEEEKLRKRQEAEKQLQKMEQEKYKNFQFLQYILK